MKNMSRLVMMIGFVFVTSLAYAHPASEVVLTLDAGTKELSVNITHQVSNPERHYIDQVNIMVNGKAVINEVLTKQTTAAGETLKFPLPDVNSGDIINVDTHCNKGGNLANEITAKF